MVGPFLHGGAPASRVPDPPALYLSASEFYDQSLAFVDGLPDTSLLLPTFRDHRAAWVERGIPFRHDWEAALTPVVDVLVARGDVDGTALLGYAISQAGYWLPWALAFERRRLAAVVDGGVVDVARAWSVNLPPVLLATLRAGDRDGFNAAVGAAPSTRRWRGPADPAREREFAFRAKPYGGATIYDTFAAAHRFTLDGVVEGAGGEPPVPAARPRPDRSRHVRLPRRASGPRPGGAGKGVIAALAQGAPVAGWDHREPSSAPARSTPGCGCRPAGRAHGLNGRTGAG